MQTNYRRLSPAARSPIVASTSSDTHAPPRGLPVLLHRCAPARAGAPPSAPTLPAALRGRRLMADHYAEGADLAFCVSGEAAKYGVWSVCAGGSARITA